MVRAEDDTKRIKAAPAKRPIRKKPKDKPKRPLSAYNYFFKEERQRILKYIGRNPEDTIEEIVVDEEEERRLWTCTNKVSFEEMGKLIGRRWKSMVSDTLEKYTALAVSDAERYKQEIKVWTEKKENEKKKAVVAMYSAFPPANLQGQQPQYASSMPRGMPTAPPGYHYEGVPPPPPPPYGGAYYGQAPPMPSHLPGYSVQSAYPQMDARPPTTTSDQSPPPNTPSSSSQYANAVSEGSYQNPYGAPPTGQPNPSPTRYGSSGVQPPHYSSSSDYPGAQGGSSSPSDPSSAPPNYYPQGGQYYNPSFQSYANAPAPHPQQRWG